MRHYPDYKESGIKWIKEIPGHWRLNRIDSLFFRRKEKNTNIISDNILSVLKDRGVIRYADKGNIGNKVSDNIENYQLVYADDIVVNNMNVTIGSVGKSDQFGALSGIYIVLAPKRDDVNMNYYEYVFKVRPFQKSLIQISSGILEIREALNFILFKALKLPTPPPSEQKRIANFLDRKTEQIDELIRIKERRIELLQEQRTALINQAVTKGLDPNVEVKPSGVEWIGEIPKHWEGKHLKYVADQNMGQSPPSEEYNSDQIGTPFLQGNAEFGPHHPTPKIYCPTAKKYASPGDILLSVRAPVGAINIADQEYGIGRGLCAIRPRTNQLEHRYAKYLLEVVRAELHVVATGSTYDAVTIDEVSNLTCVVPPLSEQIQIAKFLDRKTEQIDELITAEQRKIELLKEYRQSLISEAVTGKIDVRDEV